ncbi:MAG: hypothetical protein AAGC65_00720 [Mucilaginibacter sp.]|uniref:hypothetical protein n=1 Tax=Mucilaginibacter sp. TaxID=1882438 RepID=UPI0031B3F919
MKTPKPLKQRMLLGMLMAGLLIMSGCKKEKSDTDQLNKVVGNWKETSSEENISRTLQFSKDGSFVMTFISQQVTPVYTLKFSGLFKIKGDSLKVTLKQQSAQQGDQQPVITPANGLLYDKAIYNVTNAVLTLKYVTYPADAPVATEAKFQKQ